jgi:hypothetical protein
MALGSTQPLTEMSTRNLPGGKGRPPCKADNLRAAGTGLRRAMCWRSSEMRSAGSLGLVPGVSSSPGILRGSPYMSSATDASLATFVHSELEKCTHVFLRQDATRRALEPPYSGPYQVLSRRGKTLQLLVRGRPFTVSTDRVKLAYTLTKAQGSNTNQPAATTPAIAPPATPLPLLRPHIIY